VVKAIVYTCIIAKTTMHVWQRTIALEQLVAGFLSAILETLTAKEPTRTATVRAGL
jgi:hypothetical protein